MKSTVCVLYLVVSSVSTGNLSRSYSIRDSAITAALITFLVPY